MKQEQMNPPILPWHKEAAYKIGMLLDANAPTDEMMSEIIAAHDPAAAQQEVAQHEATVRLLEAALPHIPMSTDTPRTDAVIQRRNFGAGDIDWVPVKHARTLERELAEAKAAATGFEFALQQERNIHMTTIAERDTLRARVAELEQAQSQILTDKDYVGGVCYWVTRHDALMLRVMELEDKAANQAGRIRYLEGATNHATGTPLSHAKKRIEELEQDRDRLDWLEDDPYRRTETIQCLYPITPKAPGPGTIRHAIDAARTKGQP